MPTTTRSPACRFTKKTQFPDHVLLGMKNAVLEYVGQVTELGKTLADMFSLALGLGEDELRQRFLEPEPVVLFRCFKYAPAVKALESQTRNAKDGFCISEHIG